MHRSSGPSFAACKPVSGFAGPPKANRGDAVRLEYPAQSHCWEESHGAEVVEAPVSPGLNSMDDYDCGKGILGQGHGEICSALQKLRCRYLVRRRHLWPVSKKVTEVPRRQMPFDSSREAVRLHGQTSKFKRKAKRQLTNVQAKKHKTRDGTIA